MFKPKQIILFQPNIHQLLLLFQQTYSVSEPIYVLITFQS